MTGQVLSGVGKLDNDDKARASDVALSSIKFVLNKGNLAINMNVDKNPALITFLEKAYGIDPPTGKPSDALNAALGISNLKDLKTTHVHAAIVKLEGEGKIGPNTFKEGSDTSYVHVLSDALKGVELEKAAQRTISLGGALARMAGYSSELIDALKNIDAVKTTFAATLPPRPPASASPVVSDTAAPSVASPSAPTSPSAPATPAAPAGPVQLKDFSINEVAEKLKEVLKGLENNDLAIRTGQPSKVLVFLEKALGIVPDSGKAGMSYDKINEKLGLTDIKQLTGQHIIAAIEKVQLGTINGFGPQADPSMALALLDAVKAIKPVMTVPVMGTVRDPLDSQKINSLQEDLEKAIKGNGVKVSALEGAGDDVQYASFAEEAVQGLVGDKQPVPAQVAEALPPTPPASGGPAVSTGTAFKV